MSSIQRFSKMSLTSRTTCGIEEDPHYEDMNDEELKAILKFTIHTNEILTLENEVFERYLHRNDSQSLIPMVQVLETAKMISSQMTLVSSPQIRTLDNISGFSMRGKSTLSPISDGSVSTFFGSHGIRSSMARPPTRGLRIALLQRIEMTNKEIEEMQKELEENEIQAIKKKANLCAQIEEIQMRIRDVNIAKNELEENIIKKEMDPLTGKINAEKFIRYIELWLKNTDRIIDQLRLKSSTIKLQIKKAKILLIQREELGENLHLIDFQALAIENDDYSKKIDEKTRQMIELKKITGKYSFSLSTHKDKLYEQQKKLNNIKKQINIEENQIEKLNLNLKNTELQLKNIERRTNKFHESINNHEIPEVIEIIKLQTELQEMKKTYARLQRHGSIQLIALKTIKKHQQLIDQIKSGAATTTTTAATINTSMKII